MKNPVWGLLICLLCYDMYAHGESRVFTDSQGRNIEAELIKYDEPKNSVTIKRMGSRREMTVPITIFSEEDQKFIGDWGRLQALHDSRLKADIKRISKRDADESYGTSASTEVITDHSFKIQFENGTTTTLEDLDLEYVVFYEQEHHLRGGQRVEEKQGTLYKEEKITLPKRQNTDFETDKIRLRTWNTYSLAPIDAKILGIRVRLTMTSPAGEKEARDFCYPSSLKQTWVKKTTNVQGR